jgi:hypothetical protein
MRGDFKTMQEGLGVQFDNGVITRNEWRELEDRNAMGDEFADEAMVPINNGAGQPRAREVRRAGAAQPAADPPAQDGK